MEVATYENISIAGIEYLRLLSLEIEQKINTHSTALIVCEVTADQSKKVLSMSDESYICITYCNGGESGILFYGVKIGAEDHFEGGYYSLTLQLASTSHLLDRKKISKTFSDTRKTISGIMQEVVQDNAIIAFHITDKTIGGFWMQYEETAWGYLRRLASHYNACIIANISSKKPVIHIGKPSEKESEDQYFETKINNSPTFGLLGSDLQQYASVDCSQFQNYATWMGTTTLNHGILSKTLVKLKEEDFQQDRITNERVEGLILNGIVKEINKNKVKVFFDQIDSSYDAATDKWFEYSTAYASNGGAYGSGFYFMPEEGDHVKVFFPTKSEDDGVVIASVNVSPLDDETKMRWRSPGGQEILFTKDGIKITGIENSVFIELSHNENSEYGMQIICNNDIMVETQNGQNCESSDIMFYAVNKLLMYADNQIKFETDCACLELDPSEIKFKGESVFIVNER